ncbi:MAG TPA: EamA family transporter [Streptosporangiaceae bacterium]|nr:EamA family transporter [Streptosporangiaceae bacterium]
MSVSTLYLVLSGLLWGTGGLIGSLFGRAAGLSAMSVAACRLLAGGGLIVACLTMTGRRWPAGRAAWTRIALNGALSALFQGCYFAAISLTSVSLATLVTIGGTPVIVAIAEQARGRRAPGRAGVITMAMALAGLGLLIGLPGAGFSEAAVLASAAMALLSAAGFAAVTLIGASPVPGLDELALNGFGFTLGGLALLPLAAMLGGGTGFRPGLASAGLLTALAVGPTAVAYTLYFREHRRSAVAHRAAGRRRAGRAGARGQAERHGNCGRGHAARCRSPHHPGGLRPAPASSGWADGPAGEPGAPAGFSHILSIAPALGLPPAGLTRVPLVSTLPVRAA